MHTNLLRVLSIAGVVLWTLAPGAVWAQETDARYEFRKEHSRDGIGKFYMGREIAHVMGHQAADWLERPNREEEENPTKAIEALKLKPGEVVADIGAGTGYYSWRMAQKVLR